MIPYRETPYDRKLSRSCGIGFCGALCLLFIALRLLDVIHWSWWWVLSPMWIPWALFVLIVVGVVAVAAVSGMRRG